MNYIVIFLTLWLSKGIDLICSLSKCPDIRKGNHICEPDCMTSYCNFDALLRFDGQAIKESSDCYETCTNFDGCDPDLLGNGVCDNSCNTQNCGFDWGDCTCAPGCLDIMLGDRKCDEACDNWDCDLDNHDCGQCADGCFPTMLGNGMCDPECNNESCLYDYKDCQCAEGCLLEDYGSCKPECMVANCNFDRITQYPNNQCQNTSLAIFSSYQQIIHQSFSYVAHLEDCYKASNYNCTIEKAFNFDFNYWYEECNYLECNYGNGQQDFENYCSRMYFHSGRKECLSCLKRVVWEWGSGVFHVLIDNDCPTQQYLTHSATVFPDGSWVQVPLNDTSSSKNPHMYFICPKVSSDPETGEGTYFSPFQSFTYALHNINYKYSVVYLLDCDGYNLTIYHAGAFLKHIEVINEYILAGKHVKFTTLNNSKITLHRAMDENNNGYFPFIFWFENALSIEISNIIFDWKNTLSTCKNENYCDYCPVVTYDPIEGVNYDDRGEIISEFLAYEYCSVWELNPYFMIVETCNLLLKNVDFINFRAGFDTIISILSDTNVTFYNVTFDNIKVWDNYESSVIHWNGTGYGNLKYENGIVSRLNNGYELYDIINTEGFMKATGINSIVFRNVEFKYNAIFKQNPVGTNIASLISLNLFQALWIDSCNFLYNLCDYGIIYIDQEFNDFPIEIDDNGIIIYSKINNVHIYNSSFTSNYGRSGGVIYALYDYEGQNYLIEDSSFILNGVESGSLIHIESNYANENHLINSTLNIAFLDGNIKEGKYLAKWTKFQNSNFTKTYSGGAGIFEIIKMTNIQWEKLNIDSNGLLLSGDMNINPILVKFYIENPLIYAKMEISSPPDLNCKSLSIVSDSINFNIEAVNISKNYCKYSSPSIIISSTNNSRIKSIYFNDNQGAGSYGTCLAFIGDEFYEITNSEFNYNINSQSGSPRTISSLSNLLIQDCNFSNNIGNLYSGGKILKILSSHFDSNSSPSSNGGVIFISTPLDTIDSPIIFISNTVFNNNSCPLSGGVIYIEKTTPLDLILKLHIDNTNFLNNQALAGSCIYIDTNVQLTSDSLISYCSFQENIAGFSGAILVSYLYGILIFNNCSFVKNQGIYSSVLNIDIEENNEKNPSKIILNSCIFQYNFGNTTVSMDNTDVNSTIEINSCIFEYNIGLIFSLDNGYAIVQNSQFKDNYSPISGGALNLKNSAVFISKGTTYFNCSSNLNGGVASISLKSQLTCVSCILSYNHANNSGGVIYADTDAQFYIIDSIISKNSCKNKGSAIFMASSLVSSSISNTEIYENHAYGDGAIFILSSKFSIFSSKLYNNEADDKNPGLYLDDSNAIITNTSFSNQIGNQGCFIYTSASIVNITNSTFYEAFSNYSGIAIHATSSDIQIFSSIFYDLFSNDTGGIIYLYEDSKLSIKDSKFSNSSSSIDSYSSSILIENTLFMNHKFTAIYASQIDNLQISSSKFIDGTGINGGAIYCSQCNNISITDSWFIRNLGLYGGAIYITNEADHLETSQISIFFSNFQSNSASNGGAIWTNNINLNILSSIFEGNKAESVFSSNLQEIGDGIGGAIKISCQGSNIICYFNISSNFFSNNSASNNGGAISWDDSKPLFDNNYFENNSAQYGPDIASFPTMMIFLKDGTRNLQGKTMSEDGSTLVLNNVASGQKNNPPLTFALVDDLYQIITTDSASQAQMKSITSDTILSGSTVIYSKNGIYYFDDYLISTKPGSSTCIEIVSSVIDTQKVVASSEILQMNSNFLITVNLRLCEIGEATVGVICESCPERYYNIDASVSKCLECPSHAICYGNWTIVPKSGYWRDNKFTDKFWECPYPSACLGAPDLSNLSLSGTCDKGYENNMCHSCKNGYSRLFRNECQACPSFVSNIFRLIGISALLIFITIAILITTRNSLLKPNSLSPIYIKIFWNYIQIMIIIATYNLNWPFEATEFFYIHASLDYLEGPLFSLDCFLQPVMSKSKIYYTKIIITSVTPFIIGLLCLLFWLIIYKIKKKETKEIKDDFTSIFVVLLFLMHPSIIDIMFNVFSCKEINSGEYWLNLDLGIRCWDRDHIFYGLLVALPAITIWVVAVPYLCLINLIKNKNHLGEMWMKMRYGFLCNGYRPKHFYWEFMILFYKVILISFSVFLSNISTNIQALSATILWVLFLHIHLKNEPFSEILINKTETFSRLASLITLLTGLFFLVSDLDSTATYILLALLILINTLFITYILTKFFLQFAIINRIITKIFRFYYSKKWKYIAQIVPVDENESNQSCKEAENGSEKFVNSMIVSSETKIEMLFKEDRNNSVELDPIASMKSISSLN